MSGTWTRRPLGELCDILDSQRKPITKRHRTSGEYPYYGATGIVDYVNDCIFDEPLVLVGEDGAKWGSGEITAFTIDGKCWVNNHAHVLRPHRRTVVDNWLVYYLNHSDLTDFVTGLTVPKLNQGNLREIPVPVPPVSEQMRIVRVLDEAFAGLATAQAGAAQNVHNANALFESYLRAVFMRRGEGWAESPFEDCVADVKYPSKVQRKDFLAKGRFPIVSQQAEFTNGFWDNPADVFKVTTPVVVFGDHTRVVKYVDFDFVLGADGVKILQPKPQLLPKFFFYQLRGVSVAPLGYARHYRLLKKVRITYPDLTAQQAVVNQLDAVAADSQRLTHLYQQSQALLAALKKSLLHEAFAGNL